MEFVNEVREAEEGWGSRGLVLYVLRRPSSTDDLRYVAALDPGIEVGAVVRVASKWSSSRVVMAESRDAATNLYAVERLKRVADG